MPGKKETLESKLSELESEFSKTKDNKATNKHLGKLRSKIAETRREIEKASKRVKGKGFFVKKGGDATVALVGFPSTGKSSLLNALTRSNSKTAPYAFTTTGIIPGTMVYRDAHIQVLDMPGLIESAHTGIGDAASIVAQIRVADLIVFVVEVSNTAQLDVLMTELSELSVYVNKQRPDVQVNEVSSYTGLRFEVNRSGLRDEVLRTIFTGFGIYNATVRIWDAIGEDELISLLADKSCYKRAVVAMNKIDTDSSYIATAQELSRRHGIEVVPVSAMDSSTLAPLKASIYSNSGLIRVYLKPRFDKESSPITVKRGFTVGELAKRVHTEILDELKCAYIEGSSVKFSNQRVGAKHVLADGDIITFIRKM